MSREERRQGEEKEWKGKAREKEEKREKERRKEKRNAGGCQRGKKETP